MTPNYITLRITYMERINFTFNYFIGTVLLKKLCKWSKKMLNDLKEIINSPR